MRLAATHGSWENGVGMRCGLVILFCAIWAGTVRAEDSLEYLVAASDSVFVARFPRRGSSAWGGDPKVEVLELIKGEGRDRVDAASAFRSRSALDGSFALVIVRAAPPPPTPRGELNESEP